MQYSKNYDYIIAGAGASGLSLLWYLLHSSLREKKILVVDENLYPANDKTWCFWDMKNIPFDTLIRSEWKRLTVISPEYTFTGDLQDSSYHALSSYDFTHHVLDFAREFNNIHFLESEILSFDETGSGAELLTNDGRFGANLIFQSVFSPPDIESAKSDISLKQHFKGWEIETTENLFDKQKAILMDFDIDQRNGFSFMYHLPLSEKRSLVEYTLFTKELLPRDDYDPVIMKYLSDKFGMEQSDFTVHRTEYGVIPMEDKRYPVWYNKNTMNIGTVGGWTKPSTGYTFTRIQQRCKKIVEALEKGLHPEIRNGSSYRFRVYDIMILYLINSDPQKSVHLFQTLFKTSGFDKVLKFLDEKTSFAEELVIFSKLPYKPFFEAIYKMKHRIFTGA
ncbi:MAG: lycopene cyclase family protein [Balneolaceae bacterium]